MSSCFYGIIFEPVWLTKISGITGAAKTAVFLVWVKQMTEPGTMATSPKERIPKDETKREDSKIPSTYFFVWHMSDICRTERKQIQRHNILHKIKTAI